MEVSLQALARLLSGAILACLNPFHVDASNPLQPTTRDTASRPLGGPNTRASRIIGGRRNANDQQGPTQPSCPRSLGQEFGGAGAAAGSAAGLSGSASGSTAGSEGLGTSGALSNLTSGEGEEEATTPTISTPSSASTSGGVSTGVLLPIFIVGAVLLGGIAYFIVRDARGVAPVVDGFGNAGSAQERAARLRKRRAKAKAARRQRKRNR